MADVFEWRSDLTPWRARLWRLIEDTPHLDWLLLTKRPHLAQRLTPWGNEWPGNVWLGTTVESDRFIKKRIDPLIKVPAKVRFLSCEPLQSRLSIRSFLSNGDLHWIIAGGESGSKARPTDPNWFRNLRDQCIDHSVAFHFKQWGEWAPLAAENKRSNTRLPVIDSLSEPMARYGKKYSGRILDGRIWDERPIVDASSEKLMLSGL